MVAETVGQERSWVIVELGVVVVVAIEVVVVRGVVVPPAPRITTLVLVVVMRLPRVRYSVTVEGVQDGSPRRWRGVAAESRLLFAPSGPVPVTQMGWAPVAVLSGSQYVGGLREQAEGFSRRHELGHSRRRCRYRATSGEGGGCRRSSAAR